MADNFYVVQAPAVEDSPDVEFAQLSRVAFVKKLGKRAQLRAVDGQIHMFLRAPQTIQQMRTAVSGKLKAQGYDARVSQVSAEEFARQLAAADHAAVTPEACPDEGAAPGAPSTTTGTVARRTPLQALLDLLPSLSRLERNAVLFKIVATDAALIDCREQALLKTKEEMAKIVLEHTIAEWGGMLAPFVQEAHRQDPKMGRHRDATLDGLGLLLGYPPHSRGYKRTRGTALDPPIRVLDVRKRLFPAPPSEPERFPAAPPPDAAAYFLVDIVVKDHLDAESPVLTIPYTHFAENASWKASFHGGGPADAKLWASTVARWRYFGGIYQFDDSERKPPVDPSTSCSGLAPVVDFTKSDAHIVALEAAEKRRRGPWVIHTANLDGDQAPEGDCDAEFAELRLSLAKRRRTRDPTEVAGRFWSPRTPSADGTSEV